MTQTGFGRKPLTALQRAAFGLAAVCVALLIPLIGAQAECESQEAAYYASVGHLGALFVCDGFSSKLTQEEQLTCQRFDEARHAMNNCRDEEAKRVAKRDAAARRIAERKEVEEQKAYYAKRSALMREMHDFKDAVRVGMTAAELDQSEQTIFHNPAGWGKRVNTTVTANGTTQQWVYRFVDYETSDMYVYLHDGVVFALQK